MQRLYVVEYLLLGTHKGHPLQYSFVAFMVKYHILNPVNHVNPVEKSYIIRVYWRSLAVKAYRDPVWRNIRNIMST